MELKYTGGELTRATPGAAGLDIKSAQSFTLVPTEIRKVSTGLHIKLPKGHVGLLCSRSGLAAKHHIVVMNQPAIIDEDYTGELFVLLRSFASWPYDVNKGDRIAQLVVLKTPTLKLSETDISSMPSTERGDKGFGSSGY